MLGERQLSDQCAAPFRHSKHFLYLNVGLGNAEVEALTLCGHGTLAPRTSKAYRHRIRVSTVFGLGVVP